MKNFNEYLSSTIDVSICENYDDMVIEAENIKSGYKNETQNWDKLVASIPKLETVADKVKKLIDGIIENHDGVVEDHMFVYKKEEKIFKIPYVYNSDILAVIDEYKEDGFYATPEGPSVKVHLPKYGIVFRTGRGSLKSITTEQQEKATCRVWNAVIETLKSATDDRNDVLKSFLTEENIRDIVTDISDKFDSTWISTYSKQIYSIWNLLESKGLNPIEFRMDRVGDPDSKVGVAHDKYVKRYAVHLTGPKSSKDAFHPGDVIIYNTNHANECEGVLSSCTSMLTSVDGTAEAYEECMESKKMYVDELIAKDIYHSFSLKKIAKNRGGAKVGYFNVTSKTGQTSKVTAYDIVENDNPNNITIVCDCDLCLDGITDSEGNELTKAHSVNIVMRTFGGADCDIDVTLNMKNTPTLGKCPRGIWRKILGLTHSKKQLALDTFNEFLDSSSESTIKDALKKIIQGAIKQGPNCFPFILIH